MRIGVKGHGQVVFLAWEVGLSGYIFTAARPKGTSCQPWAGDRLPWDEDPRQRRVQPQVQCAATTCVRDNDRRHRRGNPGISLHDPVDEPPFCYGVVNRSTKGPMSLTLTAPSQLMSA